uniref:Uncharacterized protein n=1 Tax=Aegilops tauschii subsp. strangulata TaxID=200361 RepID=A0A453E1M8_AEGTS
SSKGDSSECTSSKSSQVPAIGDGRPGTSVS